jgi:hypothetical protein
MSAILIGGRGVGLATKIYADTARVVDFTPMTELHMRFRGVGVRT